MVIEGFRGSSGGGSIGGGGGMGGGHESQLSFSGVGGRPSATGFQHQVQPSSNFDRYNSGNDRDRDRYRDHDRNNNNNVIHVGGGGGGRDGYDRNNWNGYYPPYTYYNPLMYQDRQPTEIVINEDKNKPKEKMDETVKILLIVFICLFALVMLFMMLNFLKK
jgi:hypothetical protein